MQCSTNQSTIKRNKVVVTQAQNSYATYCTKIAVLDLSHTPFVRELVMGEVTSRWKVGTQH